MMQTNYHWRGTSQIEGGEWYHYPEGRSDWSGPKHGPVVMTEVVTHLIIDGVTVSTARTHSFHCQHCGVRS